MKDRALVQFVVDILVAVSLTVGPVLLAIFEPAGRWS
jgi:hypothetical protein